MIHQSIGLKHELFLRRCFELASIPGAAVEPNPRVGAVVVHNERIIGEGAHQVFGGPHAEVNAIRSVKQVELLPESTLYVSLEPCNHHGKTPPCTSLILESGIKYVVIGAVDPNPKMAGKSIDFLRSKGVEVLLMADEKFTNDFNAHFICNQNKQHPYITLKWAECKNGFIAAKGADDKFEPRAISNTATNRFVHRLRHEHHAILVGHATALIDQPSLTTRNWPGRNPLRMIIDDKLALSADLPLFQNGNWMILNSMLEGKAKGIQYVQYATPLDWNALLQKLYSEFQIGSILVEGGKFLHESLIQAKIWDSCIRIIGSIAIEDGLSAPNLPKSNASLIDQTSIAGDVIEQYDPLR